MSTRYEQLIARGQARHGDAFDAVDLDPRFVPYFNSGARVRVDGGTAAEPWIRTGTIGVTTGHRPAFLLMHRSGDVGSWDVLGPNDRIVAVKAPGSRTYTVLEGAS